MFFQKPRLDKLDEGTGLSTQVCQSMKVKISSSSLGGIWAEVLLPLTLAGLQEQKTVVQCLFPIVLWETIHSSHRHTPEG